MRASKWHWNSMAVAHRQPARIDRRGCARSDAREAARPAYPRRSDCGRAAAADCWESLANDLPVLGIAGRPRRDRDAADRGESDWATATALRAEGADVLVCGRSEAALDRSGAHLVHTPGAGRVATVVADVRSHDEAERLVTAAVDELGAVDILVNNAGNRPLRAGVRAGPSMRGSRRSRRTCPACSTAAAPRSR